MHTRTYTSCLVAVVVGGDDDKTGAMVIIFKICVQGEVRCLALTLALAGDDDVEHKVRDS